MLSGILIASGLEQAVEYFHHRYEVRETREALAREREYNRAQFAKECRDWRIDVAGVQNDLIVLHYLQQHPGTPEEKLPGVLVWRTFGENYETAAWDGAQTTSVLPFMPQQEVAHDAELYKIIHQVDEAPDMAWQLLLSAREFAVSDPDPSHLSPAQVASEVDTLQKAVHAQYQRGVYMYDLTRMAPDFPACITHEDLDPLLPHPDHQAFAAAWAQTLERLKAAGYTPEVLRPNGWAAAGSGAVKAGK